MTLADFSQGIVRDAQFRPPIDSVYDAADILFDRPPKMRKRGGTTAVFSGAQTASGQTIGAIFDRMFKRVYTFGLDASGGSTGTWRYLNPTTAAVTALPGWTGVQGFTRAFTHLGNLLVGLYPLNGSGQSGVIKVGGATGVKIDLTGNTGLIVAGNATVGTGGNNTSDMEPGMYVSAIDDTNHDKLYVGRITGIVNSTNFTVEPLPTLSLSCTGAAGRFSITNSLGNVVTGQPYGGLYGLSFQNRILLFNTAQISADGIVQRFPHSFAYSNLPTETPTAGPLWTGYTQFYANAFEADNTWDIPEIGEITGAALAAEGHVMIFGPRSCYRGFGELASTTPDAAAGTFQVARISANVGCVSDRSIQYTPQGIVFASQEGVYAFDGNAMQPLMQGRVATTYKAALKAGARIYGSAYFDGHYYLSMSDHGRLVHLDSGDKYPWTRVTNLALFDAVPDPTDATKIWGLRWWDQAGAAPSMTGGQAIQLQSITAPSSSSRADADTTAVVPSFITRAYDGDDPTIIKRVRDLNLDYALVNGTSLTVEAAGTLDPGSASWTTIGTLASTATAEPQPSRLGASVAVKGAGVAYRVTQTGASDSTDIAALSPHAERIGEWRAA